MELSQEQINQISSIILISDIKEYINNHLEEYKKFLEEQKIKEN